MEHKRTKTSSSQFILRSLSDRFGRGGDRNYLRFGRSTGAVPDALNAPDAPGASPEARVKRGAPMALALGAQGDYPQYVIPNHNAMYLKEPQDKRTRSFIRSVIRRQGPGR